MDGTMRPQRCSYCHIYRTMPWAWHYWYRCPTEPPGRNWQTPCPLIMDHQVDWRATAENSIRQYGNRGEDPSNFGITLETLAVKAFGDMGQTARLRLIRDRFIAGHESCELRRHLDCLPPDTPLRDIVDRCRVWESHADPSVRRVSKPMPVY